MGIWETLFLKSLPLWEYGRLYCEEGPHYGNMGDFILEKSPIIGMLETKFRKVTHYGNMGDSI